jgi:hypothetical protein
VGAASLLILGACSASACPTDVESLNEPALHERIGSDFVAGTAIVHRYVDSPDPAYRGYDIGITSRIAGLAEHDQVMFVAAETPMPNIELGSEVLVIGRRGSTVAGIESAGCPVLVPMGP